jgi:hypothetical protein
MIVIFSVSDDECDEPPSRLVCRPQAAEVSRNESKKASSARSEEKYALSPDERCSTRPLNRRRRCPSFVLRCTTNAP